MLIKRAPSALGVTADVALAADSPTELVADATCSVALETADSSTDVADSTTELAVSTTADVALSIPDSADESGSSTPFSLVASSMPYSDTSV